MPIPTPIKTAPPTTKNTSLAQTQSTRTTSPNQPCAPPQMRKNAALTWLSVAGKTYRILVSDELGAPLQTLNTVPSAGDGTTTLTVQADSIKRFFRVEVIP